VSKKEVAKAVQKRTWFLTRFKEVRLVHPFFTTALRAESVTLLHIPKLSERRFHCARPVSMSTTLLVTFGQQVETFTTRYRRGSFKENLHFFDTALWPRDNGAMRINK